MESIKIVVYVYLNVNSLFRKKVSILIEYWGEKVIFQLFIHAFFNSVCFEPGGK